MKLAEVMRDYRHRNGIGLRPMARKLGVNYATLCRFENGRDLDACSLIKILLWLLTSETKTKRN